MKINFGRCFRIELNLNESELYDLFLELEHIPKENNEILLNLHEQLKIAVENHKGYIMVETE
jgi:hypothetical protein